MNSAFRALSLSLFVVFSFVVLAAIPPTLFGQAVFGSISGSVTDPSGAGIPGAKVIIIDAGKGVSYNTSTNEAGLYTQSHLIVGLYEIHIEATGFGSYVQRNVSVEVDAVTQVDVRLTMGQLGQVVNVSGEVPLLKTERSDVSDTIPQKTVQELPVLQRDMSRLYFLVPGVQASGTTAASEQPQDVYRPKIGGQYWGGIAFQLDGTDNRESVLGEPVITPNFDAVSELKITTTAYDAEFGQASQAVISMQTKSGTNSLHGGAFWYRRDNNLSARNPFTQSQRGPNGRFIPGTLWNQFGGSLGGPIQKDKTFFFGDYQGSRQKNGDSVKVRVPTAAERSGDLSDLGVPIFNPCDATGNCNVPPASRQQFAGGIVPVSQQAQALLRFIPLPNIAPDPTGNNYVGFGSGIVNSDSFNVRVDRYQTEKLHMFGRYSLLQYAQTAPGAFGFAAGGQNLPTANFAGTSSLRNQSLAYGVDYSPTPNWVGDFRFGFFRYRVLVNPNGLGTSPATDAGIQNLNGDNYTSGMPAFFLNGGPSSGGFFFGYSLNRTDAKGNNMGNQCNCPLNEQENEFQWVGNVTRTFGNHAFKFGADFRYAQNLRVPSDSHRSGELTFDAVTTSGPNGGGLSLASFLLGQVQKFQRYVSNSTQAAERQHRFFTYAQDTWRVSRKLTVSYGLRWEIYFPQYVNGSSNGGFQNLTTGEVLIAGQNGADLNGNINTALTHFAPRLGVAYQVTPKTVVRMGYGRSFDVGVFGVSFGHNVTQNLPVLANQSLGPAQPWQPVFSLAQVPKAPDPSTNLAGQPKGPNGNPILPDKISPNVLPLTSDNTMRLPTVDAWNLTVERQLTPTLVVSAAYVGNKGEHVTPGGTNYDINQPSVVGYCPSPGPGCLTSNQRKFFFNKFGWSQSIKYFSDDASVKFNSLQLRGEKRFSNGMSFQGNYTWGSAFDFENSYFFWNPRVGYGRADGVRLHVFNLNHTYELPFGRGRTFFRDVSRPLDYVIGGWQLAGIWTWQSGLPFTPSYQDCGSDRDTGPCRPILVGDAHVSDPGRLGWFATTPVGNSCNPPAPPTVRLDANGCTRGPWSRPQIATFGTVARNSFFGPHFFNADASLSKRFRITETISGQFRAELFNAFNHVNLGQPNTLVDSPSGGKITSLAALAQMRRWQFGLRFDF
jgi:Carboxypeptidase regulatory-like domain/TonB dependent receptor